MRILFGIIASLGLLSALGTVLARNLVHAALFLVAFFFLVACQFVLLEAEFLAAIQVLVYIGAVAILILFGIMLTRNIQGDETTGGHWTGKIPAAIAGIGLFAVLATAVVREKGMTKPVRPAWATVRARPSYAPGSPGYTTINNMSKTVGDQLMTRYAVPFEVAGLLLTAAVVGAIALAQNDAGGDENPRAGSRAALRPAETNGSGDGAARAGHLVDASATGASAPR